MRVNGLMIVGFGIVFLFVAMQAVQWLQSPMVIEVNTPHQSLIKVNYLAPKVVLAQGAPSNNQLIQLSCPWGVGPSVLNVPPGLTANNAVGSCSPPSCPASHPELAASLCYPTGLDIPHTVVPTSSSTIVYQPPGNPVHYVFGPNSTDYYHIIGGPNGSPYTPTPGGTTPGGGPAGGGPGVGGNGGTGGSGPCQQRFYANMQGGWCGGTCPNPNETCKITGNSANPCACYARELDPTQDPDFPFLGANTVAGPVTYPVSTGTGVEPGGGVDPTTGSGEEPTGGDPTAGESSTGDNGFTQQQFQGQNFTLLFQSDTGGSGSTTTSGGGLYTPQTWWFGTVGVCVNVCR